MYKYIISIFVLLIGASCSTPSKFIVTNLGYEPIGVKSSVIYALPTTCLKISLNYKKDVFIPGPYSDYAQRMLGIEGVNKTRNQKFSISASKVEAFSEADIERLLSLNYLEGNEDLEKLYKKESQGLIIIDDFLSASNIKVPTDESTQSTLFYKDVTMESNVEMTQQTIYKTIITDTSFVNVPVTSQQMERKTVEKKAEEAAKLILEIRSDRYFLAAGIVDPFPVNFDMKTALASLDELEEKYLSLFIGKSYTENYTKEYIICPEGLDEAKEIKLDGFLSESGIHSSGGEPIKLSIVPSGTTASYRNLLPQQPEEASFNSIYYRIPELCNVKVTFKDQILYNSRISIFQAGALVSEKVEETESRFF